MTLNLALQLSGPDDMSLTQLWQMLMRRSEPASSLVLLVRAKGFRYEMAAYLGHNASDSKPNVEMIVRARDAHDVIQVVRLSDRESAKKLAGLGREDDPHRPLLAQVLYMANTTSDSMRLTDLLNVKELSRHAAVVYQEDAEAIMEGIATRTAWIGGNPWPDEYRYGLECGKVVPIYTNAGVVHVQHSEAQHKPYGGFTLSRVTSNGLVQVGWHRDGRSADESHLIDLTPIDPALDLDNDESIAVISEAALMLAEHFYVENPTLNWAHRSIEQLRLEHREPFDEGMHVEGEEDDVFELRLDQTISQDQLRVTATLRCIDDEAHLSDIFIERLDGKATLPDRLRQRLMRSLMAKVDEVMDEYELDHLQLITK